MITSRTKILSLAGVARRLDLPYGRAHTLLKSGVLKPDFVAPNNVACFRAARVKELQQIVAGAARQP